MKVLLDIEIIIDILEKRSPFFHDSYKIIQLGLEGELDAFISAGAITEIYYIINQSLNNADKAKEKVFTLTNLVNICNTTSSDINNAFTFYTAGFEDAVVAATAKREKMDFIITRKAEDFENSYVPAISPREFVLKYF